jgi:hypothetical protein
MMKDSGKHILLSHRARLNGDDSGFSPTASENTKLSCPRPTGAEYGSLSLPALHRLKHRDEHGTKSSRPESCKMTGVTVKAHSVRFYMAVDFLCGAQERVGVNTKPEIGLVSIKHSPHKCLSCHNLRTKPSLRAPSAGRVARQIGRNIHQLTRHFINDPGPYVILGQKCQRLLDASLENSLLRFDAFGSSVAAPNGVNAWGAQADLADAFVAIDIPRPV